MTILSLCTLLQCYMAIRSVLCNALLSSNGQFSRVPIMDMSSEKASLISWVSQLCTLALNWFHWIQPIISHSFQGFAGSALYFLFSLWGYLLAVYHCLAVFLGMDFRGLPIHLEMTWSISLWEVLSASSRRGAIVWSICFFYSACIWSTFRAGKVI